VVEAQCFAPVMTINASPSAVYRMISAAEGDPPTILLDEADTVFNAEGGGNEDLRGILNAGHQQGRPAIRYDPQGRRVENLETFAMAALAGIGRMPDTIEDRAVVIRMRRRAPHEQVAPYRQKRDRPKLDDLRIVLHAWVRSHLELLAAADPDMPLEDRAADTWEPLIAIADLARGSWPDRARHAAVVLTAAKEAEDEDDGGPVRLLADCRAAFTATGRDPLPTTDLLTALRSDPEAPWAAHGLTGLNARELGQILKEFEIRSVRMRLPSGSQARGYRSADFSDAWARYLPSTDPTG
jgi:hypothetical protein